ncbi:hypothetical protein Desde_2549 [Desulfitobacterium dehalogenans ATCC 51507]|uniref:Uncharacterized protein n=2 Tax=Desulfitobacterium dehalogenans TaxID=36854 RepID=I4AA94_DESDJ|nr:hypothetical protein [Desulfitobacterium dehalogenans]AFM00879.1 hypothetical protein Desde_2549 [Desulfitobacterium dehalogenans ATCC 51507]HHY28962.1 hypothetical protein [Desulfitobacterium dehalogenans]
MGVFVQQVPSKVLNTAESNSVPIHIRGVLKEFLRRHSELQRLRHREIASLMAVILFGFLSLWGMMFPKYPELSFLINSLLLAGFVLTFRQYLKARRVSQHVYINVHILYHHLLGKLEVGFCEHESPCQCAETFRKYMWNRYGISFYGNSI